MKKCISILITVLFLTGNILVNASQEVSYEDMCEYLTEHQLPEQVIFHLSHEDIEKMYYNMRENNIDLEVYTNSADIDSIETGSQLYGLINTENFTLTLVPVPFYSESRIAEIMVCVVWQWQGANPAARQEDVVKVSWNEDIFAFDSTDYSKTDFRYNHLGTYIEHDKETLPAISTNGELALFSNVYAGFGRDRGGSCLFYLYPAEPMYSGNLYATDLHVTYYHNTSLVPLINSLSLNIVDGIIGVSANDNFTDTLSSSAIVEYNKTI